MKITHNIKIKDIVYITIIVAISVLFFNQCGNSKYEKTIYNQNLSATLDSVEYFKNVLDQEVAEKQAHQGTQKELKKIINLKEQENSQLRVALKKFKKLASVVKVETKTVIEKEFIPFDKRIGFDFSRKFKKETKFYSIFGSTNQFGVNIDSLLIPNTQTIVSGLKKVGFLKTEYRFEITNSNPLIQVTKADTYNFIEKHKRWSINTSIYYGLNGKVSLGVGVGYDWLRF